MDGNGTASGRGLLRSRKKVFSFCLVMLAVTFAAIMLKGQHQQGPRKVHGWFDPSVRYHLGVDAPDNSISVKAQANVHLSEGDYAKVRSNVHNVKDTFPKSTPRVPIGGAIFADSNKVLPREGAGSEETKWVFPKENALDTGTEQIPSADSPVHDFHFMFRNRLADFKDAENTQTFPRWDANSREPKQTLSIESASNTETKHVPPTEGSNDIFQNVFQDDSSDPEQMQSKDGIDTHTTGNVNLPQTTTEIVHYDLCDKCCYLFTTIDNGIIKVLNDSELRERGCHQRLPDAMIFGVKKGGTTTLKNFISYHPDIAFTQNELKFFTSSLEFEKGVEYYRSQMSYSTPRQISMEKTPAYSHYPKVPVLIRRTLPDVKLIIIMRDPVERAVSDYVHMQVTIAKKCFKKGTFAGRALPTKITVPSGCDYSARGYLIEDTFEKSVIDSNGQIRTSSQLISKGVYVKDIQRYLKYFAPEQILAIDGEAFISDPYPAVKKVEQFLGIRDYFTRDHFYYDVQKGFFCLTKPIPNNCMSRAKGRAHPDVEDETLKKLQDYYRPYNKALSKLMNMDLNWSS